MGCCSASLCNAFAHWPAFWTCCSHLPTGKWFSELISEFYDESLWLPTRTPSIDAKSTARATHVIIIGDDLFFPSLLTTRSPGAATTRPAPPATVENIPSLRSWPHYVTGCLYCLLCCFHSVWSCRRPIGDRTWEIFKSLPRQSENCRVNDPGASIL